MYKKLKFATTKVKFAFGANCEYAIAFLAKFIFKTAELFNIYTGRGGGLRGAIPKNVKDVNDFKHLISCSISSYKR